MWKYNFTPDPNELYHWGVKGMTWGKHKYKKVVNGEYVYDDMISKGADAVVKSLGDGVKGIANGLTDPNTWRKSGNSGSASSNVSDPRFDVKDLAGEYARRKASGAANKVSDDIDRTKNKLDLAGEYARRKVSGASNKIGDMALDYAGKKITGAGAKVKNFFTNADKKKAEQERKRQANELRVSLTKKQNDLKRYQKERDRLNDELIFTKSAAWSPIHAQANPILRDVRAIESDIKANEKKINGLLTEINDETARLHELQN